MGRKREADAPIGIGGLRLGRDAPYRRAEMAYNNRGEMPHKEVARCQNQRRQQQGKPRANR
jgi:hypothetical protein